MASLLKYLGLYVKETYFINSFFLENAHIRIEKKQSDSSEVILQDLVI